jgi:hypothetical protein
MNPEVELDQVDDVVVLAGAGDDLLARIDHLGVACFAEVVAVRRMEPVTEHFLLRFRGRRQAEPISGFFAGDDLSDPLA